MSGRRGRGRRGGGRGGHNPGHCNEYKFLGRCEKHNSGECRFKHELKSENVPREYVRVPPGMSPGMVIGSGGCNLKQLYSIAQCYIKVDSEKVLIITEKKDTLMQLVEKMKLILSQEHVSGPSWSYIHPRGVSRGGSYSFRPYRGRVPVRAQSARLEMYELHRDLRQEESDDEEEIVKKLAAMNPSRAEDTTEGLQSNLSRLHQPTTGDAQAIRWTQRTRIHLNPRENIKGKLDDALRVLCERRQNNSFVMRLDARFGKVTWGRLPEEMCKRKYDIESLAELLFAEDAKHMNIFNTDVKMANAENVHSELRRQPSYYLETFDVKVTSIGRVGGREEDTSTRLDVRLLVRRSDDGQTNLSVLMVKKNEIKDVTFDIMNLHRQHDVRIGVHHYECVQKDNPYFAVVREMMGRISFPSRHMVHIQPKTSRWNIHLIRHKRKRTYILDETFAVTIATVSEHSFDAEKDKAVDFDMRQEGHAEVELHNLSWECAFGRDAEFPSGQALALHIERGSVDTREFDTVPHPWQPDSILRDFERFWGHLDTLSEKLDGEQ